MKTKLDLYQRVTPLAGLGIWERNFISGEYYWNSMVRSILEVDESYESEFSKTIQFYKHPDKVRDLLERSVASGAPETEVLELITFRGNRKWVRIRMQADFEEGKCSRIYGTLEDITENVKLLNALKEREERFSKAFAHAPIGMALVSPDGAWLKVNFSLCKLLGYTEHEFLQHTFQDYTHPEDLDIDIDQMNQLLRGEIESYSMEKRYFHANGSCIWAMLNVSLVRDELNQPMYFLSQIKDVTELRRNMETISNQNKRLLNFAHIVSHNLRSHASNINLIADMVFTEKELTVQTDLLSMMKTSAGNLLETLEHLNEIVKVHNFGQNDEKPIFLRLELERVIGILKPSIVQSDAKLALHVDETIAIKFNPAYIESILINLISNSLKYRHPDRRPEIEITAEKNNGIVILKVKDNGIGIDLELHGHKLFGMYKTFHRHADARGIGLFLVKNQIEAFGGRIRAESMPDIGTTFIIEFH